MGVLSAAPVFATGTAESVQAATETLNSVPPLEYLAKAGQTISQTQPGQRQAAAANLVAAVCRLSETAAPMMIAHLGRMAPEALPAMASAGAAAQPALAGQMVAAAVMIAPRPV